MLFTQWTIDNVKKIISKVYVYVHCEKGMYTKSVGLQFTNVTVCAYVIWQKVSAEG